MESKDFEKAVELQTQIKDCEERIKILRLRLASIHLSDKRNNLLRLEYYESGNKHLTVDYEDFVGFVEVQLIKSSHQLEELKNNFKKL